MRLEGGGAWATAEVQVERFLPEFPRRYEVRWYPDGSRAVVAWDLEALKVWAEGVKTPRPRKRAGLWPGDVEPQGMTPLLPADQNVPVIPHRHIEAVAVGDGVQASVAGKGLLAPAEAVLGEESLLPPPHGHPPSVGVGCRPSA